MRRSPRPSFDVDAVIEGRARLAEPQALELLRSASIHDLGEWATAVTQRLHPEDYRTYVIDRNVNYTNVCTSKCTFCGFRRDHDDADSYVLTHEQIGRKIEELIAIGGTQVLMQGGMNDRLPIEWYVDLLTFISETYPTVHIHAFSPPEFVEFERFWGTDVRDILRRFKAAGLKTVPGGGGEIFSPRVRRRIGNIKCSGDDWLRVMRVAHEEGMDTSCTMMMGHIETTPERVEHMAALRDLQDYALALPSDSGRDERWRQDTLMQVRHRRPGVFKKSKYGLGRGGSAGSLLELLERAGRDGFGSYTAFIHWPFQRENVPLGRATEYDPAVHGDFDSLESDDVARGRVVRSSGATDYLRTLAVARLFFDNVANLQSSWVTMGPKVGQLALFHGANDMGGAMMEENVVSAAGTTYKLAVRELCRLIRDAGFVPAQRDQYYHVLARHDGPDSPDYQPDPAATLREVRRVDRDFIGRAPGLEPVFAAAPHDSGGGGGEAGANRLQLNVLGDGR